MSVQENVLDGNEQMIDTNIYLIENLEEISCAYKIYEVQGLSRNSPNYEKNLNQLTQILSRDSRSPCITIRYNEKMCIAQPSGSTALSKQVPLVGIQVQIIDLDIEKSLNFDKLNSDTAKLQRVFFSFI